MKERLFFIVNPKAGIAPKNKTFIEAVADTALSESKYEIEVQFTKYAGHASELAKEAVENKFDTIVSVGGDGTLNEVAKAVINSDAKLGIIPSGSGNGLARCLKIPRLFIPAVNNLTKGTTKLIDVGYANEELFVSIAGVGFDAHIAKKVQNSKIRGFASYSSFIIQEYTTFQPRSYKLNIDGNEIERNAFMIVAANSNQFGYNVKVAPKAKVDDGLIDICVLSKFPISEIVNVLYALKKGVPIKKYAEYYKGKNIVIENPETEHMNIDGEAIKTGAVIDFNIKPNCLKVIIPS